MKCSQCGSEKLVKASIPMNSYGDGGSEISEKDVDIYLCTNCGHYELFSMKKVKDYESLVSQIEEYRMQLKELEKELSALNNKESIEALNNRIIEIENQLSSIDITVRQQQELQDELKSLKLKQKNLPSSISFIESKIRPIREKVYQMESQLKYGEF